MDKLRLCDTQLTVICVALSFLCASGDICLAQVATNDLSYKSDVRIEELPPVVEKRFSPGLSGNELSKRLQTQPELTLDGATLFISDPVRGSVRSLAFREIHFRNGGTIVIRGTGVEILTNLIVSERGKIVAFPANEKKVAGNAAPGENGRSGSSAGGLSLYGKLREGDVLTVDLSGQDGQDGGVGPAGPAGAAGSRGENGVDHLFDCAHGGGNGGPGARGGPGGNGGAGGAGGRGGDLVIWGDLEGERAQLNYVAAGGAGGLGGAPGPGGPGGPGGDGGHGTVHCGGGRAGTSGLKGDDGAKGPSGAPGSSGSVSAG